MAPKKKKGGPNPSTQPAKAAKTTKPSKEVAVTAKPASPPPLSATAMPFVPAPAGNYLPVQPHPPYQLQQNGFPPSMVHHSPYHGAVPAQHPVYVGPTQPTRKRRLSSRDITHNHAQSEDLARKYREWLKTQHTHTDPPVSVSRKPSMELPEGDYIGYYFKPKENNEEQKPLQEEPRKSPSITETARSTQQPPVQQLVISPNDGLEYRVPLEGPKDFLPVLPLTGPIFHQVKLPTDYCPGTQQPPVKQLVISPNNGLEYRVPLEGLKDFLPVLPLTGPILHQVKLPTTYCPGKDEAAATKSNKPSSQFLPIIDPVSTAVPQPGNTGLGSRESTETQYYGYAIIRKEPGKAPIAYVHARDDPN